MGTRSTKKSGGKPSGRLALRVEGSMWNAYYALPDTMEGAVLVGSIAMAGVAGRKDRQSTFKKLMWDVVADILEEKMGARPERTAEVDAPEHERGGSA